MRQLPPKSRAQEHLINAVRNAHQRVSVDLAWHELASAARIIRQVWGRKAASMFVEVHRNDDGDITADLLVLFDADEKPIWFNGMGHYDCGFYPGAEEISDERGQPTIEVSSAVVATVEDHIERGYEAVDGCSWWLDAIQDDHFGDGLNVLALDIDAQLNPREPGKALVLSGC